MALVRILIDGYSLLHYWRKIAPGKPRHSSVARNELIYWLTQYRDATGSPISVFFDGGNAPPGPPKQVCCPELEIIYSPAGQTADQMIERAAHRLSPFGEILVVTDDYAERDMVSSLGGMASTCAHFVQTIQYTLSEFQNELKLRNRREREKFKKSPTA